MLGFARVLQRLKLQRMLVFVGILVTLNADISSV